MSGPRIVVLISAQAEWNPVKRILTPANTEATPYGEAFVDEVAALGVTFLHGGWGKIAAAASTEYAIARWRPDLLINLGTCGGFEGRIRRGQKLLVTRAIAYDIHETIGDSEEAIRAYTTDIDIGWAGNLPLDSCQGWIASADRDLDPVDVPALMTRFGAVAGDWESAAIAYVARRRNTRLLIIRAVSDLVSPHSAELEGALPAFQVRADDVMKSLLADLAAVVPHVAARIQRDEDVT